MTYPLTDEQRRDRIVALQEQCDWLKDMAQKFKNVMPGRAQKFLEQYRMVQNEIAALAQSAEAR